MTAHLTLTRIDKVFQRKPDLAERLAIRLGAPKPPAVRAVDDVTLSIQKGEAVGLVGESGCGKSTLGRIVAGIHAQTGGTLTFEGRDQPDWTAEEARRARLDIQLIFQDPMASLNPRKRVIDIVGEAPVVHGLMTRREREGEVGRLLREVGLDPAYSSRFPHQFSGGQRQRIGIARALAVQPKFLVCDESVAALDVSIQAQVLNLFMDLRERRGLTYLFISHDLGVIEHLTDRVAIMYLGRLVEVGPTADIFRSANHPYTQALLEEAPRIGRGRRAYKPLKGEIPSPLNPPSGCYFHTRCPLVMDICKTARPALRDIGPGRISACHLNDQS